MDQQQQIMHRNDNSAFYDFCVQKIESHINEKLQRIRQNAYETEDHQKGYILSVSHAYPQGDRRRYWYGYRKAALNAIHECKEKYLVYGCKDDRIVLCIPVSDMDERVPQMLASVDQINGGVRHWHVEIRVDSSGHLTQFVSIPTTLEINIDQYEI